MPKNFGAISSPKRSYKVMTMTEAGTVLSMKNRPRVILSICEMRLSGIAPTLITADGPLADAASSLGCSGVDFKQEFLST